MIWVYESSVKKHCAIGVVVFLMLVGAWAAWPTAALPSDVRADLVVVRKADRRLDLYQSGRLLKSYAVSLGRQPSGHKERQGDGRTPEGEYRLDYRNAGSSFHKSIHISYPNVTDRTAAKSRGVDPGGLVMIHGIKNGLGWLGRLHLSIDWTDGCVAVTDREMDELWRAIPDGAKIVLKP